MFKSKAQGIAAGLPVVLALALATGGCTISLGDQPAKAEPSTPAASSAPVTNGIDKLGPNQAIANAREATAAAPAVRVNGLVREKGERYTLDVRFQGLNAAAKLWIGIQSIEIIKLGETIYFKGNDAFWRDIGGDQIVRAMRRKWLKTSSGNRDFADLANFTSLASLLAEELPTQGWNKGAAGDVGGRPAVAFASAEGEKVHVSTQGKPYILHVDAGQEGRLTFTAYDQEVEVTKPPANLIVEVD